MTARGPLELDQLFAVHEGVTCGIAIVDGTRYLIAQIAWSPKANLRTFAMTPVAEFDKDPAWSAAQLARAVEAVFAAATEVEVATMELASRRLIRRVASSSAVEIELDPERAKARW